ncbi:MAG: DNA-directed RNA polymerase subunit omega [Acidobacteria bacterium]|nr:DNA-directed RNA polymerase subunit omega [Acidobacteriota bacterium]
MIEVSDAVESKYRLILLAAKRARQLQNGARPLIHTLARKPTRIAQEELRAGVLKFEILPLPGDEEVPKEPPSPQKAKKK